MHRATSLRGRVAKFTGEIVVLVDPAGREHRFRNRPGAFALDGETVTLVRPSTRAAAGAAPALRRTAAGSLVADDAAARVARASRIWVEGDHDARLLERVWGDDLRELGIVVEPMGGIDDLPRMVDDFGPGAHRRLAVLVDHLVPGSKETRTAAAVTRDGVVVLGHPYVDVWQCVRPVALGIAGWPEVPRGEDWKVGVCRRLGWSDPRDGWRRVLSAVDTFADLEPELVGAVERALDFLADAG
ncbi:MAG: DUF3097 family protein [Actinobacteria bacterium]|nr:DUF3097 family protein [Actinomycetota bacterium]